MGIFFQYIGISTVTIFVIMLVLFGVVFNYQDKRWTVNKDLKNMFK